MQSQSVFKGIKVLSSKGISFQNSIFWEYVFMLSDGPPLCSQFNLNFEYEYYNKFLDC